MPRTATKAEIKVRYHDLARQFHPDRAQDKVLAQRLFTQINLAYRTLSDEQRRSTYDVSLLQSSVAVGSAASNGNSAQAGQRHPQPKTDPVRPATTEPVGQASGRSAPIPPKDQLTVEQALNKANAAYMSGDKRTAQQLCQNIIRADSGNAQAHLLLGDIYSELGQRVEALSEYRTALNLGDRSRLLQEKIKRLETQSLNSVRPGTPPPSSGQRPPPAGGTSSVPPSRPKAPDPPKKGGFFDKLIGRGK